MTAYWNGYLTAILTVVACLLGLAASGRRNR